MLDLRTYCESADSPQRVEVFTGPEILDLVSEHQLRVFMATLIDATDGNVDPAIRELLSESALKVFQTLIRDGNTAMIRVGGEPAATASSEMYGKMEDGRDVFSLGKVVTLPGFENRGLAKMAMQRVSDMIHKRDRTAAMRVRTKSDPIKKFCSTPGWQPIDPARDYALWERGRNHHHHSQSWLVRRAPEWMAFLFDRGSGTL